ncbi:hypothetical protein [Bremerella alba]|uniref:Lipoprotein n=1 Tax=Bremerella alba TaxID=980252 RepID=A0A7V9A5N7_9BACT|nr:hypothetical protein [Bremerella alba]MBA2113387.1 hypothetical protein [Bremerella alba]
MVRFFVAIIVGAFLLPGCGSSEPTAKPTTTPPPAETAQAQPPKQQPSKQKTPPPKMRSGETTFSKPSSDGADALGDSFFSGAGLRERLKVGRVEPEVQFEVDPAQIEAHGIRTLEGKHVTLYTDLPSSPEIDELPMVFDAAYLQWCEYFRVDPVANDDWKIKAVLMSNKRTFREAGLFPETLPEFLHGYYQGDAIWLLDQPSDYYRRHLLIHEGTHAFMFNLLGGAGPPWYMEGMAEHFGTHRWVNGQLETRVMPASKEATPMWGRIKIIQDEVSGGSALSLTRIMGTSQKEFLQTRPYAWCWGACAFLDNHSLSQESFRDMVTQARLTGGFSERLMSELGDVIPQLAESWELFVTNAEYGYNWQRNEVEYREPVPFSGEVMTAEISTDRGWQSTGILLDTDSHFEVTANGEYVIRNDGQPWMCEPNGVTIHYWKGKPLGQLVGSLRAEPWRGGAITPLAQTNEVGLGTSLYPEGPCVLFLKVNESPDQLGDNLGTIQVQIKRTEKK